jgi:hypothetical protein
MNEANLIVECNPVIPLSMCSHMHEYLIHTSTVLRYMYYINIYETGPSTQQKKNLTSLLRAAAMHRVSHVPLSQAAVFC